MSNRFVCVFFCIILTFFTIPAISYAASNSTLSIISVKVEKANVYSSARSTSKKVTTLFRGEEFPVLPSSSFYYYKIQSLDGKTGYIKKSQVQLKKVKRVVMGWNYFGNTDSYIKQNSVSANLNVVSPRWYSIVDSETPVAVTPDTRYVNWAHSNGKQVWPLIGNKFNPALTDAVLSNPQKRQKVVSMLKDNLVQTGADGINIDFENMDMKNKGDFVSFVKELRDAVKPYGKVVSVDVTRTNPDPNWSGSLDRRELGKIADFIILMGYDEHWGGGGKAGSTASIPWIREGIQLLHRDVPSHKIILGVPFYTKEWVTDLTTNAVSSVGRSMPEVEKIIADRKLTKTWDGAASQHYVEFTWNNQKHQIWIEDKVSLKQRCDLVEKYKLRGVAAWYIGQETPDVWTLFDGYR